MQPREQIMACHGQIPLTACKRRLKRHNTAIRYGWHKELICLRQIITGKCHLTFPEECDYMEALPAQKRCWVSGIIRSIKPYWVARLAIQPYGRITFTTYWPCTGQTLIPCSMDFPLCMGMAMTPFPASPTSMAAGCWRWLIRIGRWQRRLLPIVVLSATAPVPEVGLPALVMKKRYVLLPSATVPLSKIAAAIREEEGCINLALTCRIKLFRWTAACLKKTEVFI